MSAAEYCMDPDESSDSPRTRRKPYMTDFGLAYDNFEQLVEGLNSDNSHVRTITALHLRNYKDKPAVEPLIRTLEDDDSSHVRGYAADSLGHLGDLRAVDPLIRTLESDAASWPRRAAAEALGKLGDPRAVEPLIRCLRDTENSIRAGAAATLGELHDPRALEPLLAALRDSAESVRSSSAKALESFPDARTVEPLAAALLDDYVYVRLHAALALAPVRDPRAVQALIPILSGDTFYLRSSAHAALERFEWQPSTPAERAADAVANCRWEEAGALGAVAVEPLLAVLEEAYSQFEDLGPATLVDGARQALETVLTHSAPEIEEPLLERLAQTQIRINYADVVCVYGNWTTCDSAYLGDSRLIQELARAELARRHIDSGSLPKRAS